MIPKINRKNLRKFLKHPSLITYGLDELTLSKKHVKLHIDKMPNFNESNLSLIDTFERSVKSFCNDCYSNQYLYYICKKVRPNIFIETGVHYGASSAFILKALNENNGKLYSIDLPNTGYIRDNGLKHIDELNDDLSPGFVVPDDLRQNWNLILGDSKKELPKLIKNLEQPVDIFHHDSVHTYEFMMFEFETAFPKIANGGLLLSDDADWNPAFKEFCESRSLTYKIINHKGIAIKR